MWKLASLIGVLACLLATRAEAYVYWAEGGGFEATTIGRANLDGTGVDPNFIGGLDGPCGVAVDGQHLYWGSVGTSSIGRANLDGTGIDQSFIQLPPNSFPCGPSVGRGEIWWADFGPGVDDGAIGTANVDGSDVDPTFFISPQAEDPFSVALTENLVFWANQGAMAIGRGGRPPPPIPNGNFIDLDPFRSSWVATDETHLYATVENSFTTTLSIRRWDHEGAFVGNVTENNAIGGLALDAGKVYWANALKGTISRANPDGSSPEVAFISGAGTPFGLAVDAGFPGNDFEIGKLKRNKRKGTGKLTVEVSNPGALELTGKGLKKAAAEAADAGEVQLRVKAKGAKKRKLKDRGKVKLEAEVTFSPTGGTPATEDKKVKLIKK